MCWPSRTISWPCGRRTTYGEVIWCECAKVYGHQCIGFMDATSEHTTFVQQACGDCIRSSSIGACQAQEQSRS